MCCAHFLSCWWPVMAVFILGAILSWWAVLSLEQYISGLSWKGTHGWLEALPWLRERLMSNNYFLGWVVLKVSSGSGLWRTSTKLSLTWPKHILLPFYFFSSWSLFACVSYSGPVAGTKKKKKLPNDSSGFIWIYNWNFPCLCDFLI